MGRAFFSILIAARHHASAGALAPPSCRSTHFRVTAGRASAWGLITQQRHRQRRRPRHRPPHLIPGAHQVSLEGDGLILSRLLEAWINLAKVFLKSKREQGVGEQAPEILSPHTCRRRSAIGGNFKTFGLTSRKLGTANSCR